MKKSKSLILLCMACLVLGGCDFFSSSSSSSSSSNTSSSGDETGTGYAIIGDFVDGGWNPEVDENSDYYIAPGTPTYTLEATFVDSKEEPGFRVVEYGKYENYLDYSNLDPSSTGVLDHTDNSNNVLVSPGAALSITFNLGENKSILVTDNSASSSYDGQYLLYGSFKEESNQWKENNTNETYLLPYVTTDSSSKYWQRTVTLAPTSQYEWDPSFRIIEFGDYDKTIAGYSNLTVTSNTSVTVSEGDSDNLKLPTSYAGEKLDLTIDLRNSTYTINIDTHDASFTECNGYPESTGGDSGSGSGSEDTGSGSGQTNYDSYYSLTGDFVDSSWNGWPSEDSIYYLGYDSSDSSTKYWERTVTMAGEPTDNEWWNNPNTWNASFYVASVVWNELEEKDDWTLIAGYSHLASGSTGVLSSSSDGGIEVSWNKTYDLVIDLRGSTPSILVTELVDTGGSGSTSGDYEAPTDVKEDTYYVLYGGFSNSSWNASPTKQENTGYALGFDSRYQESRYWTRTVTTDSNGYGFRLIEYGNYDSLVAGYSNFEISSSSSAYVSAGDANDNNIKLASNNTSYDITIDMRTGNFKLTVAPHSSSFVESDGYYDEDPTAFLNNYSSLGVGDDYIMGADISSIAEVEAAGGEFYDYQGNKVDCIEYLASQGINYARLRLWVDPTDGSGNSYLGGGNNLNTDMAIAKRCVEAGMKICLDLHYSDFWTHHGQQFAPKSWRSYSDSTLYSAASSWTTTVLTSLASEGVNVSMVQVGNETNNNAICGTSGTEFFKQCCQAVRNYSQDIDIVIHYALDQDVGTYTSYYQNLVNASVSFDVIGLSYYPYYHLAKGSLDSVLSSLTNSFPTKEFCIMEYSSGWTLTYPWDNQGTYGTTNNTFGTSQVSAGGYGGSVEEQTRCIYDINKSISSISKGLGSFYWEPAWLAREQTAWASSNASSYYSSNNSSLSGADCTTWSNQALFDYRGYALDSLKIYNIMWGK